MSIAPNQTSFGMIVHIARSGEKGTITGFARHMRSRKPQFYVEYTCSQGTAAADWFYQDEIEQIA